jgi:hypothetical protein
MANYMPLKFIRLLHAQRLFAIALNAFDISYGLPSNESQIMEFYNQLWGWFSS